MAAPTLADVKSVLWPHQVRGVDLVQEYLKECDGRGSALVRFPTGTGKTGVIATATLMLKHDQLAVVLSPSTALCRQLSDEIRADFWPKLGLERPRPQTKVEQFFPSTLRQLLEDWPGNRGVLVGTVQSLAQIRREQSALFEELAGRTSLVVFDEGHREPARKWGEACRGLDAPTVLFSATPYRNDYALFDIHKQFVESFSFDEALSDRCIRSVDVKDTSTTDVADFVTHVWEALESRGPEARAIVRCANKASIVEVMAELRRRKISGLGIHERFTAKDGTDLRSSVPRDKNAVDARIWVHQNKLLEGIDDPRFSVVAIYDGFGNARSLVQQVGRVIRNPGRKAAGAALLLVRDDRQAQFWENYRAFEKNYEPERQDVRDLIFEAINAQPAYRYIDEDYRKVFDPLADGFVRHLRFRQAANIYQLEGGKLLLEELREEVVAEWDEEQRIHLNVTSSDSNTEVILYAEARNSPILRAGYYIEDRLGFTVLHRSGDWLFYYDSLGLLSEAVRKRVMVVPAGAMHGLYGGDARTTSLSMKNTDIGQHSLRSRTVQAHSLAQVATGLSDHGYLCSTAQGYIAPPAKGRPGTRRYMGVANGRLTESGPKDFGLAGFLAWAAGKTKILNRKTQDENIVFRRFARHVGPPDDTTPRHILLDIGEYISRGAYRRADDDELLDVEDLAVEVENDRFTITANGCEFEVTINYNEKKQRYHLESKDLDAAFVRKEASDSFRRGLVAQMNIDQAFRVVPTAGWTIYAHGLFVEPTSGVGSGAGSGFNLLGVFTEVPALGQTTSEKGGPGTASEAGWSEHSVFGLIDRCVVGGKTRVGPKELRDAMSEFDLLVCDDMGKESSDFLCGSTSKCRLVAIHAKHKDTVQSASSLQDVCAQAMKNLGVLQPFSDAKPTNHKHWSKEWTASAWETTTAAATKKKTRKKVPIGKVPRLRRGSGGKDAIWKQMAELRRSPDTLREVWIVLGKTLKLEWFREQQQKATPEPEAVQAFYLLESLWTSVSAIGARLRIFVAGSW